MKFTNSGLEILDIFGTWSFGQKNLLHYLLEIPPFLSCGNPWPKKVTIFLALGSFFWLKIQKTCVWRELIYRKIPLRCPERIYGQRTIGLYSGRRGGCLYSGGKSLQLQSVKLTFLSYLQFKNTFRHFFTSFKKWNMFKVNNKDTKLVKLTIKTSLTCPGLFIVNFEHISDALCLLESV